VVETEVKIRFAGTPDAAVRLIEGCGFSVSLPRVLEADQIYDRESGELRASDRLLRLRRSGATATVTYKGPAARERYKSREEVEFRVDDPDAFELVLERLGYQPRFRYEKYRTIFREPGGKGIVTLDETPIGVFLELEGEAQWIDASAARLGFSHAEYCTLSYAAVYREYLQENQGAPVNMIFEHRKKA
jgi:adenylate cyclase class 2